MTMDDSKQLHELVDDDLLARLETYADARLTPDPAGLARMRASVVAEARARSRTTSRRSVDRLPLFGGVFSVRWRRPVLGVVGATFLIVALAGGALAGSVPGGPLYGARLWLETVTLPGDPDARTDAEIARLENRLEEAASAAAEGDGPAVSAALQAYRDTIDVTLALAGDDLTREERLQTVLEQHRIVLETLVTVLDTPGQAADAIKGVIGRNAETIERIVNQTTPAGSGNPNAPGQSEPPGQGGGNPNAPGQSEPPGQGGTNSAPASPPGQSGSTAPTPKPSKSPKPSKP